MQKNVLFNSTDYKNGIKPLKDIVSNLKNANQKSKMENRDIS